MPKETKTKASLKGQASINSFFSRKKRGHDTEGEESEKQNTDQHSEHDDDESDAPVPKKKDKHTKTSTPDASKYAPICDIGDIFDDLVGNIESIRDVTQHVAGRKLRVATMCSGTESPLLALELIQKAIHEQYDLNLDVEHVFSCEIEPFKQAYIERNFHPPILFRDVCELGDSEASVLPPPFPATSPNYGHFLAIPHTEPLCLFLVMLTC